MSIDPAKIVAGGDSAGANLAAVLTLIFRDDPNIRLNGQLLIYPPVDFRRARPSYTENANGPLLVVAGMPAVNAMYCPDPADLEHPHAAPFLAADHKNLPPAFIAVAEHDPLRDDGVDYADKLKASGVDVVLDRGKGLIHGYLRSMEFCSDARDKLQAMAKWLADRNAGA
jgi:acetyl esterase/lipase